MLDIGFMQCVPDDILLPQFQLVHCFFFLQPFYHIEIVSRSYHPSTWPHDNSIRTIRVTILTVFENISVTHEFPIYGRNTVGKTAPAFSGVSGKEHRSHTTMKVILKYCESSIKILYWDNRYPSSFMKELLAFLV